MLQEGNHKPRGPLGGIQMTILLHKALLCKRDHEGEGRGSKIPENLTTWFMDYPLKESPKKQSRTTIKKFFPRKQLP